MNIKDFDWNQETLNNTCRGICISSLLVFYEARNVSFYLPAFHTDIELSISAGHSNSFEIMVWMLYSNFESLVMACTATSVLWLPKQEEMKKKTNLCNKLYIIELEQLK